MLVWVCDQNVFEYYACV